MGDASGNDSPISSRLQNSFDYALASAPGQLGFIHDVFPPEKIWEAHVPQEGHASPCG
jgi:hypothetical protein